MDKLYKITEEKEPSFVGEEKAEYGKAVFVTESEEERLLKDAGRPGIEKLQLFTKMIRRNVMLQKLRSGK